MAPAAPLGALLLRLVLVGYWGVHRWFKVGFREMPATVSLFEFLGLPDWLAWFDISFEFLAVLLFTGVLFRLAVSPACLFDCDMIFHGKNGFYFPSGGIGLPSFWTLVQASRFLSTLARSQ